MNKHTILLIAFLLVIYIPLNAQNESSKDYLKLGGAFRYTYMNNSWNKAHDDTGGKLVFDTFILNAKGRIKSIEFSVESRYYAESFGGFMLRNGYVALPLLDNLKLKLGMPRTPFGILPFTGNSFMFNIPYYLGFEDDADLGFLLEYKLKNFDFQFNFAKNSEDVFSSKNNRYAYDISGDNEELNQFTLRGVYKFGNKFDSEIGCSLQYGQIYNTVNRKKTYKYAFAIHSVIKYRKWDIKAQTLVYRFSSNNVSNVDYITLGAFAADYKLVKRGVSSSLSIGYSLNINHKLLNDIKFYNDFSTLNKLIGNSKDTYMNVTGCMLHTGPIYVLIDYVLARNHPWIGNNYSNALYSGNEKSWNRRFNINLGIYF